MLREDIKKDNLREQLDRKAKEKNTRNDKPIEKD